MLNINLFKYNSVLYNIFRNLSNTLKLKEREFSVIGSFKVIKIISLCTSWNIKQLFRIQA